MSIRYYTDLLLQRPRIEAFRRAIAAAVRPGDHVLDLGTGLGTFACFAADAGAALVWGVEGHPVVHAARAVARRNGYGDRVRFVRGWLQDLSLPRRADVVIFEDFPPRLLDARVHDLLVEVRGRYAAPRARMIPAAAELFVAPVRAPVLWRQMVPFAREPRAYGIDWSPLTAYLANGPAPAAVPPDALVAPPVRLGRVAFDAPCAPRDLGGAAVWHLDHPVTVHGLAYWFDLELGAGERLSNGPGAQPGSWRHLFLPLEPPVEAAPGELAAAVTVHPLPGGAPGWLAWQVQAGGTAGRGHEFAAEPASRADLGAASPDGVPRLSRRGRLEGRVLALTDGRRSLGQIARVLVAEQPDLAPEAAARLVARVLAARIVEDDDSAQAARSGDHDRS